jgi:pimeloyl-ACP methyl ester carboxylesterase
MWEAVCDEGAQRKIASFTSVSGPNIAHLGMWARSRLSRPTPKNVALVLAQLVSFGYMFYFMLPWLPKAMFALTLNRHRWRKLLSRAEGAAPEDIFLAPTFEEDIGNGLRIYRANITSILTPRERLTRVPVQLIVGTRDPAVRQASYADALNWAPAVWRRVVKGGHWLPFSHPEMLATATTELIDATEGLPPAPDLRRAQMATQQGPFDDQLQAITGGVQ